MTAGRVYLAAPVVAYGTLAYDEALSVLRALISPARLLDARSVWRDRSDWLDRRPALLRTLDMLAYVPGPGSVIGVGVVREIADAYAARIPVSLLDDGRLRDHSRVRWRWMPSGNRARVAFVAPERSNRGHSRRTARSAVVRDGRRGRSLESPPDGAR